MHTTKVRVIETLRSRAPAVVIEIGAHDGGDTEELWHAAGGDKAWYLALEPDPRNAEQFRIKHSSKPIRFYQAAASDRNGLTLYRGSEPYTGSGSIKEPKLHLTVYPNVHFPDNLQTVVQTLTLDEIVSVFGLTHIDVIWCDVQGAEDLVIAGGKKALAMTRWFHTEFYDDQIYEGQMPLKDILSNLPGEWEPVDTYLEDVLLRNKAFTEDAACSTK